MHDVSLDKPIATAAARPTARRIPSPGPDRDLPMLYVTRYCALEPASLAAAVHDALAVLATYAARHPGARYGSPVVAYRNRQGTTVTIDVGLPLDNLPSGPLAGELRLGAAPPAEALAVDEQTSFGEMLKIGAGLASGSALRLPGAGQIAAGTAFRTTH
jgi:hypothetical protein